jgi:hypothetical protein
MQAAVVRAVSAFLLLVVGSAFWTAGQMERRMALAHRHLSALKYADAVKDYDDLEVSLRYVARVPWLGTTLLDRLRAERAAAQYWLADYGRVSLRRDANGALTDADPDLLLLVANATYRGATKGDAGLTAQPDVERILKGYADLLKTSPGHADGAFNYELLTRVRAALAKKGSPMDAPKVVPGITIHGVPGAPPKGTDMGQFKVVIPKRGEERKEDTEAGSGQKRIRKG